MKRSLWSTGSIVSVSLGLTLVVACGSAGSSLLAIDGDAGLDGSAPTTAVSPDGGVSTDASPALDAGDTGDAGDASDASDASDAQPLDASDSGGTLEACPAGSWDHDGNASTACVPWTPCPVGTRIETAGTPESDQICTGCTSGTFSDAPNQLSCTPWSNCLAGTYVSVPPSATSDRECTGCPSATFTNAPNESACLPQNACPAGTLQTAPPSSSSPATCEPCDAGTHCPGGTAPRTACAPGTWDHDGSSATACVPHTQCVPGQRVQEAGSATTDRACVACASGTFSVTVNAVACAAWSNCEARSVISVPGTATFDRTCVICPNNGYTLAINQTVCKPSCGAAVPNDLALCLDAENPLSYPGSGSVWLDLSGRNHHATLRGWSSPQTSTVGGVVALRLVGSIAGTGDIEVPAFFSDVIAGDGTHTFEWWGYVTSTSALDVVNSGDCDISCFSYGEDGNYFDSSGLYARELAGGVITNEWHHYAVVQQGSTSVSYRDGVPVATKTNWDIPAPANRSLVIGSRAWANRSNDWYLGMLRWHDRALTAPEVTVSFEALRARFGL
jgi:hypothetical protein